MKEAMLTLAIVLTTAVLTASSCNADNGNPIVKIVPLYTPPASFSRSHPHYRAASSLTLSCQVEGVDDTSGMLYEWTSDCSGSCFAKQGTDQRVTSPYLHSYDSGVHTCTVYDALGCTSNASITVKVVGAGVYVETSQTVLANNSLIVTSSSSYIPNFRCLSGSNRSSVGRLIGPNGKDTTFLTSDPFLVYQGNSHDPGTLYVKNIRPFDLDDSGVYTYRTPDENGNTIDVHVGLYDSSNANVPRCSELEISLDESSYVVTCPSTNSPPTQVIWEKDGRRLYLNDSDDYQLTQTLVNRRTSAYNNTLTINGTIEDVVGEYSCTVSNSLGTSNKVTRNIRALEVTGHETAILVDTSRNFTCRTHLNVTRMEWVVTAISNDPLESREDGGQILVLSITPSDTGLDGARLACRITTAMGKEFEETITVSVKEFAHTVSISGPDNPLLAGDNYTLTCTVQADLTPTLKWLDSDGEEIDATLHPAIRVGESVSTGNTTTLELSFDPIKLSHGGTYTCISSISEPQSFKRMNHNVKVKVTTNNVIVERSPNTNTPYISSPLRLTCSTHLNTAVDVPVQVRHTWTGPGGVVTSGNGITVSSVTGSGLQYQSTVSFTSLDSSDSGTYTCSSSSDPNPSSVFLASSAITSTSTSFRAVIGVNISISYTAPDQYPDYSPPNYRAASSVSLRCVSTTDNVTYRWSSTCSSCFASSSSSQTISENFLRARDIGVHTCTVTDGAGNTGSATITMNIVGAGIYVDDSQGTGRVDRATTGAQPQNSYAIINSGYTYSSSSQRFSMYCCSNSTSSSATFTLPNGYTLSSGSSYNYLYRTTYAESSTYRGCTRLYVNRYYYSYYLSSYSLAGIHTCNIADSHDNSLSVNIGLYDEGFRGSPSVYHLLQTQSYHETLALVCRTRDAPPTNIRWYRDGEELDISDDRITVETNVTNRRSSYYDITLRICDTPSDVSGEYECEVGNSYGNTSSNSTLDVKGLEISDCSSGDFVVGSIVRCRCSSTSSTRWYKNSTILSSSDTVVIPVSTDSQGEVYTCQVNSPCGTEEESVTLDVTVPNDWASINITSNKDGNLNNTEYSLLCTVTTITGMNLPITVEWVGPDSAMVTSDKNRKTVGEVVSEGRASTLTLSFDPVFTTDGGRYTCRATVNVPWTSRQPAQLSHSIDMSVTTQAIFQLKMYPLPHCSKWDPDKTQALENSIKKEVQDAVRERCKCAFNSHAIHSGEFSCQGTVDPITNATYRAIVNGTTDLIAADKIVDFIGDWRNTAGTLKYAYVYSLFRLRLVTSSKCKVSIDSFTDEEC